MNRKLKTANWLLQPGIRKILSDLFANLNFYASLYDIKLISLCIQKKSSNRLQVI